MNQHIVKKIKYFIWLPTCYVTNNQHQITVNMWLCCKRENVYESMMKSSVCICVYDGLVSQGIFPVYGLR